MAKFDVFDEFEWILSEITWNVFFTPHAQDLSNILIWAKVSRFCVKNYASMRMFTKSYTEIGIC